MAQRKKTDINRTAVSSTRHLQSKGGNTYGRIKGILAREADIWNWKENDNLTSGDGGGPCRWPELNQKIRETWTIGCSEHYLC